MTPMGRPETARGSLETRGIHSRLAEARQALQAGKLREAERGAHAIWAEAPHDVETIRLLANIALARSLPEEAERWLRHAVANAPASVGAHADLASLLCSLERSADAVALLDAAMARQPDSIWPISLKAAVHSAERQAEEALKASEAVVARAPGATVPWMNYAHALKTVGRTDEAVIAYRTSLDVDVRNGGAWWGLANLRTIRLDARDVAAMEHALRDALDPPLRVQLTFALGKALADVGDYEGSFRRYDEANRLRSTLVPYDTEATGDLVRASEEVFTSRFFADRAGQGCDADDVIFIVGLPRSGSTLVEQILASHPMIEGVGELFELQAIATQIVGQGKPRSALPDAIAKLDAEALRKLGERYLLSTRRHRRTNRPFFTDKLPANWQLAPLIRLILPKARIIDVRRNPLACCFSAFSTYFNRQTSVPTGLAEWGRYYRDYIRMMDHLDKVLPGYTHRVRHECLVHDFEVQVRDLSRMAGVEFDPACLRFHETQRPIHTPSAQQVRQPVNRGFLDHWRNFEPWLEPLAQSLDSCDGFDSPGDVYPGRGSSTL